MNFREGDRGASIAVLICDCCGETAEAEGIGHRWACLPAGWLLAGSSIVCGALCALISNRESQ